MMRLVLAALLMTSGLPATAQIAPRPGLGDDRLQTVDYDPVQVVQLRGAPGYQLTVELSPDEHVENVSLGDSSAWQVSANRSGDRLFIKPGQSSFATNMTVITNVRVYNFELVPLASPMPGMPFTVRFNYPARLAARAGPGEFVDVRKAHSRVYRYRISGAQVVRPGSITQDGQRTYVSWPKDRDLPATYEIGASGEEMLTNGMMHDDILVIDRVVTKMVFRRDRLMAKAELLPMRRSR